MKTAHQLLAMNMNAVIALVTVCVLTAISQSEAYDMDQLEADMNTQKADIQQLKAANKILTQKILEGEIYGHGRMQGIQLPQHADNRLQPVSAVYGDSDELRPIVCQYNKATTDLCVDPCTPNNSCKNGGACTWIDFHFECTCPSDAIGIDCGMKPCDPSPCKNGGVCSVTATSFSCACTGGFTGNDCGVNPCDSSPCKNGGVCSLTATSFSCACAGGFTGNDCGTFPYPGFTYNAASNAYYQSFTEKVIFTTAVTRCTAINAGAHLSMFTTSAQYTAFRTYVANLPAAEQTACAPNGWWIGLRRQTLSCGTTPWVWDLGNGNTAAQVADWGINWSAGEPNCNGGQYYARVIQTTRLLDDLGASYSMCYICQISAA